MTVGTKKANIYEFRTHFAKYAKCVREGETITLCTHNKPFAEVRPLETNIRPPPKRPMGLYSGKIGMSADFDSPAINKKIAEAFLGESGL
jgi:antitoxin (DNA-binding transcriptional repressor) of toxin-antitoxin stability system